MGLPFSAYRFSPKYWSTGLVLVALTFFMLLGFWQLQRAQEKNQILTQVEGLKNQPAQDWQQGNLPPSAYAKIRVRGRYTQDTFLFDNQHIDHRFGYNVLSALVLAGGQIVLVDRGWVAGDLLRQNLPDITTPKGELSLLGRVYYPSAQAFLLGEALEPHGEHLALIEALDTKLISQFLHKSVYPFIIRLGKNEDHGFIRQWPLVSMSPTRHIAYAVQWFAFACLAFVLYIGLNFKKKS